MLKSVIFFVLLATMIMLGACKVNQVRNGMRTGLWITKDSNGELGFKSRGRYKNDKEKGTWKFFYNDTLYQKDKYSGTKGRVKFFHPNKKLRARGKTQMEFNGKLLHWYYTGDWKYFDEQGNLMKIITYKKGDAIAEIPHQPGEQPKRQLTKDPR